MWEDNAKGVVGLVNIIIGRGNWISTRDFAVSTLPNLLACIAISVTLIIH